MSRGGSAGMSGANNIPLGRPGGQGGQLAQAASSLGGISLLNPSYLSGGAGPDPNERAASSSSSGRRSKFGPPVAGIGPPPVMAGPGMSAPGSFSNFGPPVHAPPVVQHDEPSRKRPNMDLINNINAQILGKALPPKPGGGFVKEEPNKEESREERRKKRKSRWGGADGTEKTFIPGMPTMMPQGLSQDQEEAYLLQLKIEDASRRLRTGDLGIPLNPEDRFEKLLLQINGKNSSFTLPTA